MPLQATSGAASYDAFGGGVAAVPNYIEDVFSTYLYTGNGSTQTITNGIDLSTKGGLVWCKIRNTGDAHALFDTARGFPNWLASNTTGAQNAFGTPNAADMVATSTGFSMNNISSASNSWNSSGNTFASWTFRKQPKFFDVVTYTGDGTARTIAHNLGSAPGCIIIKKTSSTGNWATWHRSGTQINTYVAFLNSIGAYQNQGNDYWGSLTMSSTVFSVGTTTDVNASGATYVAYLFAHDAGGFGLTGTDNVISCGSYTGNGSTNGPVVTLGYEPQWIMVKNAGNTGDWVISDVMRGLNVTDTQNLIANGSASETTANIGHYVEPTSTGFKLVSSSASSNQNNTKYIYIAIRRGPMKVPTSGTSVFTPVYGTSSAPAYNSGFVSDAFLGLYTPGDSSYPRIGSRLTGTNWMQSSGTGAETADGIITWDYMSGVYSGYLDSSYVGEIFRRAPSFFDEVCYTGTGVAGRAVLHNLGVAPELLIAKERSGVGNWEVIAKDALGGLVFYQMNSTQAGLASRDGHLCFPTATFVPPTATQFVVGADDDVNGSGSTYVAYLFATCAGVSKVGNYTGTGTTLQVDCGFTGGARFVLIKRTDSTGAWYVWDSARGIVSGNDPYQLINTTSAQVTSTDYIDTYSAGFEISSTAPAAINASGGTYIFLAIA